MPPFTRASSSPSLSIPCSPELDRTEPDAECRRLAALTAARLCEELRLDAEMPGSAAPFAPFGDEGAPAGSVKDREENGGDRGGAGTNSASGGGRGGGGIGDGSNSESDDEANDGALLEAIWAAPKRAEVISETPARRML